MLCCVVLCCVVLCRLRYLSNRYVFASEHTTLAKQPEQPDDGRKPGQGSGGGEGPPLPLVRPPARYQPPTATPL
eukprot:COSAG05_NODE_1697_length_4258_cov_7.337822_5_plen_74_part_00